MRGRFITFEGVEGCGKSTQIGLFAGYLRAKGIDVVLTREPGGTPIGDQIREILLNPANTAMAPVTELLLYAAARAQHAAEKIRPALKRGAFVLSDRYADATTAYQGAARHIGVETLKTLHEIATGDLIPDVTFVLDLPAGEGLARARSRNLESGREDRLENEETSFHERVRKGYLALAKAEPDRVILIDAGDTIENIHKEIVRQFEKR